MRDKMSETFVANCFVQNFSFSSIPYNHSGSGLFCLGANLSALFFSGWFMGASSKYKLHSIAC